MTDNSGVRGLYEAFPFPARDAATERSGNLPLTRTDILGKVVHHVFAGRRDFRKPFRALVAGGGTGDAAIFLAAQLQGCDAEVVYLDISEASLAIARERARVRGLESGIRWIHGSLLDAPRLGIGPFDYVSCLGVLHHLADPDAGLRALSEVLTGDGGMGLMVYGRYGRADVYAMQDLMRLLNRDEPDLRRQIANFGEAVRALSPSHLMLRGRNRAQLASMMRDEPNLVDTFLHVQDRAYTVPEVYRFVASAGLSITNFTNFHETLRIEYDPDIYFGGEDLPGKLRSRTPQERHAIGELLHGHMYVHGFYAARPGRSAAGFLDPDMVPYYLTFPAAEEAAQLLATGAATLKLSSHHTIRLTPTAAAMACLARVDGERSLGQIWSDVGRDLQQPPAEVGTAAAADFERFNALNWVFLRHRDFSAPPMLAYAFPRDAARTAPPATRAQGR